LPEEATSELIEVTLDVLEDQGLYLLKERHHIDGKPE